MYNSLGTKEQQVMNILTKLIFCLISLTSVVYGWDDYRAEDLDFKYTPSIKSKVSDSDYDRPATNTGLRWMKKKTEEKSYSIKTKKTSKKYACYGSLKSSADAFGRGRAKNSGYTCGGKTYVRSHWRTSKNGKTTFVRGHFRRK